MQTNSTCFDYIPEQNERHYEVGKPTYFPYGGAVSESVTRCLEFLITELISADERELLFREAAKAKAQQKEISDTNKSNLYPIANKIANRFPVYACLAHFNVTPDPQAHGEVPPGRTVADIARIAALLIYLGKGTKAAPL